MLPTFTSVETTVMCLSLLYKFHASALALLVNYKGVIHMLMMTFVFYRNAIVYR